MLVMAGCTPAQQPNADPAVVAAVAYREPGPATLTLYTMINNRTGQGGHTSLMINASERVIFDPSGSFRADVVPERDDVLFGVTPNVELAYRGSHARSTHHVLVQKIKVTSEQAEIAYRLALSNGRVPGAFCTSATSKLLQQVPGFENIKTVMFPTKLSSQFEAMPGVQSSRYYEDDSADLQDGLARNNAALNATLKPQVE
ncbi:MAG: hypothetical protein L3J36_07375 [Rhodobacteraceae bacterium]|nr:hypothetical protein [Paracoccaceae bacterium]